MMIYYGRKDKKSHEKTNTKHITPKKQGVFFSAVKMEILMYAHFATLSQEIACFHIFSCNQHSLSG